GAPVHRLMPVTPYASSCIFVLPTMRQPESSRARTTSACRSAGGAAAKQGLPMRVANPSMSIEFLTPTRRPSPPIDICCTKMKSVDVIFMRKPVLEVGFHLSWGHHDIDLAIAPVLIALPGNDAAVPSHVSDFRL